MKSLASRLDRRVRIERPVADTSFDGAGSGNWALVVEVAAEVQDVLPSRGETGTLATTMTRPARVRIRYREGITSNMRFVCGSRAMYIISGPAELGRREALEFMVAEYLPAGSMA